MSALTSINIYFVCAILLLAIGLLGFLLNVDFIRKILGLNIIGIAIFMFLLAISNGNEGVIDPVPHAMVLTGIVIAAAGTALGLNLASKVVRLKRIAKGQKNVD
ncbi:NADH-quinone oxidoreductase subunit K [Ningiella sp. W23]|uniref:NADH-quinone oxidoreductase subunit K n=1 Tax=Ningiella sp. W23 TaxID=3023715 RepID=UPI00375746EC